MDEKRKRGDFDKLINELRAKTARQKMTTRTTLALPNAEWFQKSWKILEAICGKPQDILLYCMREHFVAELEDEALKKDYIERFKSAERYRKSYVLREVTVKSLKETAKDLDMSRNQLIAALVGIVGQSSKDEFQERINQQKRALEALKEFLPHGLQFSKKITEIFEEKGGSWDSSREEKDQDPLQRALYTPIEQLADIEDIASESLHEGVFLNFKFFEKAEGYIL